MKNKQILMVFWLSIWTIIPVIVFLYLELNYRDQVYFVRPRAHFYIVGGVSAIAAIVSTVIGWIGAKLRNVNVLLLALAFTSLFGFFALHGLSTPDVIEANRMSHVPAVASQLGLTTCAAWLLLSTVPSDQPIIRFISQYRKSFTIFWLILLIVISTECLIYPEIINFVPVDSSPLKYIAALITNTLFLLTGERYLRQYRFSQFPIQMSVTYSVIWLCIAQAIVISTAMWTLAWWMFHVILLIATIRILYGVTKQYLTGASLIETFRMMFSSNLMDRVRSGISNNVQALIRTTEEKDSYTAGHNLRVAMYALQLADELRIPPERARALAQGGIVHDVGKVEVPVSILNKPGPLTPDERKIIEMHPVIGYEMCKQLGFMKDELDVVRFHHEKWDGSGYPDGRKGLEIPELARILSVVDVFDALTSARSYRQPWTPDRALQFIIEHSGTQFDPECVNAWVKIYKAGNLVVANTIHQS